MEEHPGMNVPVSSPGGPLTSLRRVRRPSPHHFPIRASALASFSWWHPPVCSFPASGHLLVSPRPPRHSGLRGCTLRAVPSPEKLLHYPMSDSRRLHGEGCLPGRRGPGAAGARGARTAGRGPRPCANPLTAAAFRAPRGQRRGSPWPREPHFLVEESVLRGVQTLGHTGNGRFSPGSLCPLGRQAMTVGDTPPRAAATASMARSPESFSARRMPPSSRHTPPPIPQAILVPSPPANPLPSEGPLAPGTQQGKSMILPLNLTNPLDRRGGASH